MKIHIHIETQILKDTKLADDFQMVALAERTEGLSGSDLKELCRNAAMLPMREMLREVGEDSAELARLHKEVRITLLFHLMFSQLSIFSGICLEAACSRGFLP